MELPNEALRVLVDGLLPVTVEYRNGLIYLLLSHGRHRHPCRQSHRNSFCRLLKIDAREECLTKIATHRNDAVMLQNDRKSIANRLNGLNAHRQTARITVFRHGNRSFSRICHRGQIAGKLVHDKSQTSRIWLMRMDYGVNLRHVLIDVQQRLGIHRRFALSLDDISIEINNKNVLGDHVVVNHARRRDKNLTRVHSPTHVTARQRNKAVAIEFESSVQNFLLLCIKHFFTAGKEVEKGTTISYKVSSGPDTTSVPDLTDMTEAQARNALDMAGFGVDVTYQENDSVTEGTVISWNPSGKQKPGATITVVIAKKSGKANVPGNLYGKSISSAVTALNNAGFYNIAFCDQNGNPVSGNENATVTGVSPTGKQSTDSTITLTVSISGSGTDSGDDSGTTN